MTAIESSRRPLGTYLSVQVKMVVRISVSSSNSLGYTWVSHAKKS